MRGSLLGIVGRSLARQNNPPPGPLPHLRQRRPLFSSAFNVMLSPYFSRLCSAYPPPTSLFQVLREFRSVSLPCFFATVGGFPLYGSQRWQLLLLSLFFPREIDTDCELGSLGPPVFAGYATNCGPPALAEIITLCGLLRDTFFRGLPGLPQTSAYFSRRTYLGLTRSAFAPEFPPSPQAER